MYIYSGAVELDRARLRVRCVVPTIQAAHAPPDPLLGSTWSYRERVSDQHFLAMKFTARMLFYYF